VKRVLIIEDDPSLREVIAELLEDVGYEVAQARNGLEGLDEASHHRPDLILLDLMMPAMNGWQFRAAQKEDAALATIPVIVMSAFEPEEGDEALEDVAARFPKPFDVMALLEGVRRHAA
jgi:CheY-like chemotaxis protein